VVSLNFDDIYERNAIKLSDDSILGKNYYDDDIRQTVAGSDRYVIKSLSANITFECIAFAA
jgi:hypothetical protein